MTQVIVMRADDDRSRRPIIEIGHHIMTGTLPLLESDLDPDVNRGRLVAQVFSFGSSGDIQHGYDGGRRVFFLRVESQVVGYFGRIVDDQGRSPLFCKGGGFYPNGSGKIGM